MNSVQLGMDLTWDIFISIGSFFFALVMFNHPKMNKIINIAGMVLSELLLRLNLAYLSAPPGEVGSVEIGPFIAIWYIVLITWLLIKQKAIISEYTYA